MTQFLAAPPYEAWLLLNRDPARLRQATRRLNATFGWLCWPAGAGLATVLRDVASTADRVAAWRWLASRGKVNDHKSVLVERPTVPPDHDRRRPA